MYGFENVAHHWSHAVHHPCLDGDPSLLHETIKMVACAYGKRYVDGRKNFFAHISKIISKTS
jgi:hypothetical protein